MISKPYSSARFVLTEPQQTQAQMLYWSNQYSICCFLETAVAHDLDSSSVSDRAGDLPLHFTSTNMVAAAGVSPFHAPTSDLSVLDQWVGAQENWIFGHLGFPHPQGAPDPEAFGPAFFYVPETVLECQGNVLHVHSYQDPHLIWAAIQETVVPPLQDLPQANFQPLMSREEYLLRLEKILDHIHRGDCYEINFCQYFQAQAKVDTLQVYRHLVKASPNPFSAYYKKENAYLCCASPERFLQKKGNTLFSQPIKGTAPRDLNNATQDQALQKALGESAKEKRENVMVVDLVRNDMSRVCQPGSVEVSELFGLYRFPQVHQMISTIQGKVLAGVLPSQIFGACFPMGSMTGAPKAKVLELIATYENAPRGLYSGALGYFTPTGDFDFNVVIRSLLYNAETQTLRYGVGSGITAASSATSEYEECLLKAAAIRALWAH